MKPFLPNFLFCLKPEHVKETEGDSKSSHSVAGDESHSKCLNQSEQGAVALVQLQFLPVGGAVGSLAGATLRGRRRRRSPSEHRRAVIPVGGEGRRAAATPDSDDILPSHADQQGGALGRRQEISDKTPTCKTATATGQERTVGTS